MSEFKINVKTTHEGDGATKAKEELKNLESSAKDVNKTLKEAQHAAKAFGDEAEGAAKGVRGLLKEAGAVEGILGKLGSQLGSILSGAALGVGITIIGNLLGQVWQQIREILELLDILQPEKKVEDVTAALGETKTAAEQVAEKVEQVGKAFGDAAAKADELRKKQDEMSDAKLAMDLSGVDVLEAAGPSRGGITQADARLLRTSLRLGNEREKTDRQLRSINEREKVIQAMQAFSQREYAEAFEAEGGKDARMQPLLERASKILGFDKDKLKDPIFFEKEYNKALAQTHSFTDSEGGSLEAQRNPEQEARAKEIQSLEPLLPLLKSPTRRLDRARAALAAANAVGEEVPELERQKRLAVMGVEARARAGAADVYGVTGNQAMSNQLLTQINAALANNSQANAEMLRRILGTLNVHAEDLTQLRQQLITNNPYR